MGLTMRLIMMLGIVGMVLFVGLPGGAGAAEHAGPLQQAIALYRKGAHDEAGRALAEVLAREPRNATAHFFAGLALQGEGKYAQSIDSFEAAGRFDRDYAQLAAHYVGLALHKTGRSSEATARLKLAVALDPASETAANARALLQSVQEAREPARQWQLSAGLGWEYDDNLTVEEQDLASDQADFATVFELGGLYRPPVPQPYEAEISYRFYQSLYDDYSQFDLQTHTLGLSGSRAFDGWDGGIDYSYSYMFLGREGFLQSHRLMPNAGFFLPHDLYARLSYSLESKDFRKTADNGRDVVNQSLGGDLFAFFQGGQGYVQAGYRLEHENASLAEYDFWGHNLSLALQVPAAFASKARFSYKYTLKDYTDPTAAIGVERHDNKHTLGAMLSRRILDRYELKAEYQYIDSDSNLEASEYTENILFVGLSADF